MKYFISDVHLGFYPRHRDKEREDILLQLLDTIKNYCSSLYILGDFFDYWFEYKTVIPKYFYRTLTALHEIRKNCEIEYVMGNHDFGHLKLEQHGFFEEELGIKVHRQDITRTLFNKKFYLSHGDGKAYNDNGYRAIKKITQNETALRLYMLLHPNVGISLASNSSHKSRRHTDSKNYGTKDGMRDFAAEKICSGYDYVVMGHRHRFIHEIISNSGVSGEYINLGDWLKRPVFGRFDGNEFEMLYVDSFIKGITEAFPKTKTDNKD